MYRLRTWSVRHARLLKRLYASVEAALLRIDPLLRKIGYRRLDKPVLAVEKLTKGLLLDSQSCGQCIVAFTGMSCPMNCPKRMRNGPCGGVRPDGTCEVDRSMNCVWVQAWEGNKRLGTNPPPIQVIQPPVDHRLVGHSAWLRELQLKQSRLATSTVDAV